MPKVKNPTARVSRGTQKLSIEYLYCDLTVCGRCLETNENLDEAIAQVAGILEAAGVVVEVKKIHVRSETQARALKFISSPTIRINQRDIQLDLRETVCDACGNLCGQETLCRVWVYRGKEYPAAPKPMIINAMLQEVYGGTPKTQAKPARAVPENLKRFFTAQKNKEESFKIAGHPEKTECC